MHLSEFLRLHEIRSPNVMWFLGAGASASAGVPTAFNLIWDFKRTLYCSAQKVSVNSCADLGSPLLRAKLQSYFDSTGQFPPENSDEEYSHYFKVAYPDEQDRRRYIDQLVGGASPSFGHLALATLLRVDRARIVWTTNFDSTIEDATVKIFGGTSALVTATLDSSQLAMEAINEGRWPLLVKLHGDFRSRRLKNTTPELQAQDARMRRALVEACKRFGLAVVGYSGRDRSIMDAFEEAIDKGNGYPLGLFWFQRSDSPILPRVESLIAKATAAGIQASIIQVETFDELLSDVLLLVKDIPSDLTDMLDKHAPRVTDAPIPETSGKWPVVRLNALPMPSYPTLCRRVVCKIGGFKDVREAVERAGVDVITSRRKVGVLAFGRDVDVRQALAPYEITEFDIHAIEPHRLRWESAELSLLYSSLSHAITRERPLKAERLRGDLLRVETANAADDVFKPLRTAVGDLTGTVPKTNLAYAEAVRIKVEYRLGRLWLLIEPTVWIERSEEEQLLSEAREFTRNRLAGRFNQKWNEIIDAWAHIITNGQHQTEISSFGIGDGIDATFVISSITAFSWRAGGDYK
jgi:NAD-dependent SIR2 family protein deacetylase